MRQRVGEFHGAGGLLVAGSDAGMPGAGFGEGLHRELAMLVEIGMTPTEALQAATSRVASVLDEPDLGVIREGAFADLVAVEGRPHEDIRDAAEIRLVLRDGRPVVDGRE